MMEYQEFIYYGLLCAGINWGLPAINSLLFAGIFWTLDYYSFYGFYRGIPVFMLVKNGSWHEKLWRDWYGLALFWVIFVAPHARIDTTLAHERRHCLQVLGLGLLQPIFYWLISGFIWVFLQDKHAYLDNLFERDARKAAGQIINVPKSSWPQKRDRWPWW